MKKDYISGMTDSLAAEASHAAGREMEREMERENDNVGSYGVIDNVGSYGVAVSHKRGTPEVS